MAFRSSGGLPFDASFADTAGLHCECSHGSHSSKKRLPGLFKHTSNLNPKTPNRMYMDGRVCTCIYVYMYVFLYAYAHPPPKTYLCQFRSPDFPDFPEIHISRTPELPICTPDLQSFIFGEIQNSRFARFRFGELQMLGSDIWSSGHLKWNFGFMEFWKSRFPAC